MAGVEKKIETSIVNYLKSIGALVETQNSGKVLIKKGQYNHMMTLQTSGCPDIIALYKGHFMGIEVKKDIKECEHWIKQKDRYDMGEVIPKSYKREKDQIEYMYKIKDNGGTFILTSDLQEVKEFINNL